MTALAPAVHIDIDMLDYRMAVAYEDLMDESCRRVNCMCYRARCANSVVGHTECASYSKRVRRVGHTECVNGLKVRILTAGILNVLAGSL